MNDLEDFRNLDSIFTIN